MTCPVYQLLDALLPPGLSDSKAIWEVEPATWWGMGEGTAAAAVLLVPFGFHRNLQHPHCFNSNEVTTQWDHQAQGRTSRKIQGGESPPDAPRSPQRLPWQHPHGDRPARGMLITHSTHLFHTFSGREGSLWLVSIES